ncbi:AcvB/VirJ family lysyl-phosphatidylglycerol hydrolase [Kiritimatiellota bacterium B12222]|nr:AcvB/VirJ family lysyl-phosphatidylglycerol hydrolase [Kiritimatiellota bacterium B12222]
MKNLILKGLTGKIVRFISWFAGSRRGPVDELEELPLVLYGLEDSGIKTTRRFVVLYSGDGGWAHLTSHLASALQTANLPVVGIDCMRYFWGGKTAAKTGHDLGRIVDHFSKVWDCDEVVLVGYSMGADVLPGAIGFLDSGVRERIRHISLIGMSQAADYTFRFSGWLGFAPHPQKGAELLLPLIEKLSPLPVFSVCGEKEVDSLCQDIDPAISEKLILPGGHHFGGEYTQLTEEILIRARRP